MTRLRVFHAPLLASSVCLLPAMSGAQGGGLLPQPPQLSVSATADVEVKPDQATLTLTIESRGNTAAKAGAETARKARAVIDTVKALGVSVDLIKTLRLDISPEYSYPGKGEPPRLTGYVARNSIRVDVRTIDQTGALIDAALAKEASGLGALQFSSSKADEARLQALARAVAKAREEAAAMATAAGGSLGGLVEMNASPAQEAFEQASADYRMARMSASTPPETPVSRGLLKFSALVSGKWVFIPK